MLVTSLSIIVALAWATWLFSGSFQDKHSKVWFLVYSLVAVSVSAVLYFKLGASSDIEKLNATHAELANDDLKTLLEKTSAKEISIETLFSEVRYRNLMDKENAQNWMVFGRLLLQSEQLELAEQAFGRASQLGDEAAQQQYRLETAQSYIDKGLFDTALVQINRVLLINSQHEGALLLRGLTAYKLTDYQMAIDSWKFLLLKREPESSSALFIKEQIADAEDKLAELSDNYIEVQIENFANLPLQSFTKAFVLVRASNGGPPIAVKSFENDKLQKLTNIGSSDLMLGDSDLWQVTDIYIEIRLSKSGFAKAEPGDLYGRTAVLPSLSHQAIFS